MLNEVPIHDLNASYNINIEKISHKNTYDYNTIHKHNYFEILFFEKGGGYQLIDFNKVPIKDYSCYLVKPKQVHLVERSEDADGLLVQFTQEMLFSDSFLLLKNYSDVSVVFENNSVAVQRFFAQLENLLNVKESNSVYFKEKSVHLLSALLYSLEECSNNLTTNKLIDNNVVQFIDLVEAYLNNCTVNEYAKKLNISTKKLSELVKKELQTTPLKYIHDVLLLNIKRDLVFRQLSHKEIAYNYNFDSPSNFSLFVKKQTGLNPTELQKEISLD